MKSMVTKFVQKPAARLLHTTTARRALWWIVFTLLSFTIMATNLLSDQVALKAGEVAPKDIFYSGRTMTFTSELKTSEARTRAAQEVDQIYHLDRQVLSGLEGDVTRIFQNIDAVRQDPSLKTRDERVEKLQFLLPGKLPLATLYNLVDASLETLATLEAELKGILRSRMQNGVTEPQLVGTQKEMISDIAALSIHPSYQTFLKEIVNTLEIRANKVYDPVATAAAVENRLAEVKPVQVTIQSGEKIVEKGSIVSAGQIEALQFLGLQRSNTPFLSFVGLFIFVAIIYGVTVLFLRIYRRLYADQEANIILIGILINATLLAARFITAINISDRPEYADQLGYLIPVAACSMLAVVLMDTKMALYITLVSSLFIGVLTNGQMAVTLVAAISGLVSIYAVSHLNQRTQLVRASLYVSTVNLATIFALGLMWNQPMPVISLGLMMGFLNGILASVLTIGTLPFFESGFGVTTSVKLLELSNPNHPLLKRLMMEAPGTYNHSILVGNLGEAASEAIGADSLLVRVASYYHDIGKVKRPFYFIENQMPGENPHDKIAPTLSTLIITSHVKDGVELAREHRFPKALVDIIEQHHGTSLVSYFHHKAREGEKPEAVLESDFRYQTPKPQNREAAIIMLADSIQAAMHVLVRPTKGVLESRVREIIKQKLMDGQLEECDLTFRDLEIIAQAFVRVLGSMFHNRIEYPDQVDKEMERSRVKNGNSHKEPAGQDPGNSDDGAAAGKSDGSSGVA